MTSAAPHRARWWDFDPIIEQHVADNERLRVFLQEPWGITFLRDFKRKVETYKGQIGAIGGSLRRSCS